MRALMPIKALLGRNKNCFPQTRGLYQPKTATVDLMVMPPSGLLRIWRPVAKRKSCINCRAGGTRDHGLDDLATAGLANSSTINDTLGPAKAHLVEIEIRVLRTDMMTHAGHCAADPGIEALHRIDVNRITNVLATGMVYGLMIRKAFTDPSSLINRASGSICVLIARSAARNDRPVTTAARASPAGVPGAASAGRCTIPRTGVFSVFA